MWGCMSLIAAPHKSGLITGAAVGGSVLVLLLILAGVYGFHQKRRAAKATKKNDPFGIVQILSCLVLF